MTLDQQSCSKVQVMNKFFQSLWHQKGLVGYLSIWTDKQKNGTLIPYEEIDSNETYQFLSEKAYDTGLYFGVCMLNKKTKNGRAKRNDIRAAPGFWIDLDIGGDEHKSTKNPPTTEEAMMIFEGFPYEPTIMILSGHGMHLYFLFKNPSVFNTDEDRKSFENDIKSFQQYFIKKANQLGYNLDVTSDITRSLRVAGSMNFKNPDDPKEVIIQVNHADQAEFLYDRDAIMSYINGDSSKGSEKDTFKAFKAEGQEGTDVEKIRKYCYWFQHCIDDASRLPEIDWFNFLRIISFTKTPKESALEYSKSHPEYDEEKTLKKLKEAQRYKAPIGCKFIEETFVDNSGDSYCKDCPFRGRVKSPVGLGKVIIAEDNGSNDDIMPVYYEWLPLLLKSGYFLSKRGCVTYLSDGFYIELSNFIARATNEIIRDNGVDISRSFRIKAVMEGGINLPTTEINATDLYKLDWVMNSYGIKARINSGLSSKGRFIELLQKLSLSAETETRYQHIGWRKINDTWCYLHANGNIGSTEKITVEADHFLGGYALPEEDVNPIESFHYSMKLLDIAPKAITIPLLALTYLAPLTDAFQRAHHEPNFLMMLVAKSGSRKTTIAKLFLRHFREESDAIIASFKDTPNSLEYKAFRCKDSLFLVDDFHPGASRYEKDKMAATIQHIIRLFGDKIGKGRLTANIELRKEYPPRGVCLMTGEDKMSGLSSLARCLIVEMKQNDLNLEKLTEAQKNAKALSKAMFGYISLLASMMEELPMQLEKEFLKQREEFQKVGAKHGRSIEAITWLQIAYKQFLNYGESINAIDKTEVKELLDESKNVLISLVQDMDEEVEQDRAEIIFLTALISMVASREYRLDYIKFFDKASKETSKLLGWRDDDYIYLNPDMTYGAVCDYLRRQSREFPSSQRTLWKSMSEAGIIATEKEVANGKEIVRTVIKKTILGERRRVVKIIKAKMDELLEMSVGNEDDDEMKPRQRKDIKSERKVIENAAEENLFLE